MQTENKMAVMPVGKLIWQMSIPPLISMFLQYSYNLIDSAFVARLSENALTAVSLSFPITTLMNAAYFACLFFVCLAFLTGKGLRF